MPTWKAGRGAREGRGAHTGAGRLGLAHGGAAWMVALSLGCAGETTDATAKDGSTAGADATAADPTWPWLTVIDTMGFTRQKPLGVAPGFDLDGIVTTAPEAASCKKLDMTSPEGVPGIDNELAKLVPAIEASGIGALEGLIQSTINDGGIMLMMQIDGLDAGADAAAIDPTTIHDDAVTLRIRAGSGVPLLGTDGLLVPGQTFHIHDDSPEVAGQGRVTAGILEAGPMDVALPLVVFGVRYNLDVRGVRVRARLAGRGQLVEGVFGGGLTMASILDIAQKGAADQKNLVELVTAVLGGAGDLALNPTTGTCEQVSAALAFTGVNGYLFEDTARRPGTSP